MSIGGVPVGICKVQADPVCGNTPTGLAHVTCNVSNVDRNTRVEETAAIDIAGGTPGRKCFYLELPNERLPPEIVVDTCTGIDPVLDGITGRYRYTPFAADNGGFLIEDVKGETACLCECNEQGEDCINRIALTIWRRFYCFGTDGQLHPAGGYWIDHYPALEYTDTNQTQSATNSADSGSRYVFTAYTNPGYAGPGGILPPEAAANGYSACYYGFPTDECPPGDCNCGTCDGSETIEPLQVSNRSIRARRGNGGGATTPSPELVLA